MILHYTVTDLSSMPDSDSSLKWLIMYWVGYWAMLTPVHERWKLAACLLWLSFDEQWTD